MYLSGTSRIHEQTSIHLKIKNKNVKLKKKQTPV